MRHRSKRFSRYRSNGRNHHTRENEGDKMRLRTNSFSNGRTRSNFKTNQSAEKLVDKYNVLAKEALSSGDRILSENYFQHADHFRRIVDQKNLNQNKNQVTEEAKVLDNKLPEDLTSNQNKVKVSEENKE